MQASYPGVPYGEGTPRESAFVSWLKETATDENVSPEDRRRRLQEWESVAPFARFAHPREEHLLPLHVIAAYTGFAPGQMIFDDFAMGGMSLACVGYWDKEKDED